ncbi:MobF family relaxase [Glutamicibacter ardleyensis]|uniref:MobF family relaxase n=1 Tax=Glutamicibacter ardleyensis TaxID=225894 RepID=UPI003FD57F81
MTLHKLSAGDGYQYYTREVASADELRTGDRTLGDYYTVTGHPPGIWGGRGAKNLGVSGAVTEEQMELLYGLGQHPLAGQIDPQTGAKIEAKLGQRYKRFDQFDAALTKKITTAMGDFTRLKHREPTADERRIIRAKAGGQHFHQLHGRKPKNKEELSQFISRQTHKGSNAVAGYDMVFSPSKSISYLWGVSDRNVQAAIEKAHHAAIEDAMMYLETNAVFTRRGKNGVRSEDVAGGLIYTSFRHYDSRDGDPQLHDHIVVSNKVLGMDGKWSALDGTVLHKYAVSASEHYNAKVMQYVCKELGVSPVARSVEGKRPIIEIGGVPMAAIEAASSRRSSIKENLAQVVAGFEERHGRAPNAKLLIKLSQQATLETRAVKKKAVPCPSSPGTGRPSSALLKALWWAMSCSLRCARIRRPRTRTTTWWTSCPPSRSRLWRSRRSPVWNRTGLRGRRRMWKPKCAGNSPTSTKPNPSQTASSFRSGPRRWTR